MVSILWSPVMFLIMPTISALTEAVAPPGGGLIIAVLASFFIGIAALHFVPGKGVQGGLKLFIPLILGGALAGKISSWAFDRHIDLATTILDHDKAVEQVAGEAMNMFVVFAYLLALFSVLAITRRPKKSPYRLGAGQSEIGGFVRTRGRVKIS